MKNKLNLPSKIHFIGIGGAGMNPLAGICLKEGIKVTGSDSTPNKNQDELRALGADIWTPHSAEELAKRELPDICVCSYLDKNSPESIYLDEKDIDCLSSSELYMTMKNSPKVKQFQRLIFGFGVIAGIFFSLLAFFEKLLTIFVFGVFIMIGIFLCAKYTRMCLKCHWLFSLTFYDFSTILCNKCRGDINEALFNK